MLEIGFPYKYWNQEKINQGTYHEASASEKPDYPGADLSEIESVKTQSTEAAYHPEYIGYGDGLRAGARTNADFGGLFCCSGPRTDRVVA